MHFTGSTSSFDATKIHRVAFGSIIKWGKQTDFEILERFDLNDAVYRYVNETHTRRGIGMKSDLQNPREMGIGIRLSRVATPWEILFIGLFLLYQRKSLKMCCWVWPLS
jgi:hypothetical protein